MTTNEKQTNQQQQVLFSDIDINDERDLSAEVDQTTTQQLFENSTYLPDTVEAEANELEQALLGQDIDDVQQQSHSWFWRVIFVIIVMLIGIETFDFFIAGFQNSPITTSLYAALMGGLLIAASSSLFREYIGLKQFKNRQSEKHQVQLLLASHSEKGNGLDVEQLCQKLNENLPCDIVLEQEQAWQEALSSDHSPNELIQLYSRIVLTKVDEKAMNDIAKFSTEAVVLVGLSPLALADMLIILSRNLRMINKIAGLYGLKLGYWSRIKLIKQVFVNMAYAGASELVADLGSDVLGAELMGKFSTKFAQGLGAGMLTARLGIKTIQLCRPIAFDDKPQLKHVRSKVLEQVKNLISKRG